MKKTIFKAAAIALATSAALTLFSASAFAQSSEIKIGVSLSTTGPGASLGIPEKQALSMLPQTLGGKPVRYIMLDDATDPAAASKNARRLIEEEKVDAIIGSSTVPTAIAVATVAAEGKTPAVALSPFVPKPGWIAWSFSLPQPVGVMSAVLFEDMAARKVQSLAFIGYNDSYGEAWLKDIQPRAEASGIKLVATERFARTDQSVAGQTVKLVSSRPDAVVVVGSGTPSALPMTSLRDRGYKGPIYQTHGVANNDFLRVGGKAAEGMVLPAGALLVAEQLPAGHPSKAVASDFVKRYEAKYGAGSRDLFAGYAYDAYLLLDKAAGTVPASAQAGTPAFRQALRDAIENTSNLPATHGTISVSKTEHSVYDASSRVLVKVQNGGWRIEK